MATRLRIRRFQLFTSDCGESGKGGRQGALPMPMSRSCRDDCLPVSSRDILLSDWVEDTEDAYGFGVES